MTSSFSGIEVRRMAHADLDPVIEIEQSLPDAPHWPRSAYITALDPQTAPPRIALVAEETNSGVIVGFAAASLIPPQAELETIAVASNLQRRGLARRLFTLLAEELRGAGASEIILEVRASNQSALGLYRSLGFLESGRRSRYYVDPVEDALLMSLAL
jgi:ribosomal-protein-alanine N-acetyltransferase